jgi:hypothetical protein
LEKLSSGTESLSLLAGGDGMHVIESWENSTCLERVNLTPFLRMRQDGANKIQQALHEELEDDPDLTFLDAGLRVITKHAGVVLNDAIGRGPLFTAYKPAPVVYGTPAAPPAQRRLGLGPSLGTPHPDDRKVV